MKKEKLTKSKYRKPTIEVFPLPGECSILAGTEQQLNTGFTLMTNKVQNETINLTGNCITITSDDGDLKNENAFGEK